MVKRIKRFSKEFVDIEKVSLGYDRLLKKIALISSEAFDLYYPPYNIKKTGSDTYAIDLEVTGYNKEDIVAKVENGALVVTAPDKVLFDDPEGDDEYFHQGIFAGGELYAKFYLADNVELTSAEYDDGLLTFNFVVKNVDKASVTVPIGPFVNAEAAKPFVPVYNSKGEIVGKIEDDGTSTYFEKDPVVSEPAVEVVVPAVVPVLVNTETEEAPVVTVIVPEIVPQIVEVSLDHVADVVDNTSETSQVEITLNDATHEVVSDDAELHVIKTEDNKSDIIVAVPVEVKEALEEAGVDVKVVVEEAVATAAEEATVSLPETPIVEASPVVEVKIETAEEVANVVLNIPETLPQVVQVVVTEDTPIAVDASGATVETGTKVELVPVTDIPADAIVTPIITAEGEHDAVVVITPEDQVKLEDVGVDAVAVVEEAVLNAESQITPVDTFSEGSVVATEQETLAPEAVDPVIEEPIIDQPVLVDVPTEQPAEEVLAPVVEEPVVETPAVQEAPLFEVPFDPVGVQGLPGTPSGPAVEPVSVVVNSDSAEAPTVEVQLPEVLPQIVEVSIEHIEPEIDSASTETQVVVKLEDATFEVKDNATLEVVPTEEGKADLVVSIPEDVKRDLEAAGVDIVADIAVAVEEVESPAVIQASEEASVITVESAELTESAVDTVEVPAVLEPVMEATISEEGTITLAPVADGIPADAELHAVVTGEGQNDIVVAVTPETKDALVEAGVTNISEEISTAVIEADATVAKTE